MAIRFGYMGRNPAEPRFRKDLHDSLESFNEECTVFTSAATLGFALLGSPGLGKTTSIARILRLYPQVILHRGTEFHHTQVVWLFLTCPHDKSTRGLCLLFFQEVDAILGTDYHDEYSGDNESSLIAGMATVAAVLSLGVLIIDEIQFLSAAKSGGKDDMLKFFVQLENTLGIPIVLVGTHRAAKLVAGSPHQARRSVGMGGQTWKPLPVDDPEWSIFLDAMWEHQFVKHHVELNPELRLALYEESQGMFNYAVDLFYYAQVDAINNGTETISVESIRTAAINHMEYNRPYINALRGGDQLYAEVLEDMVACDFEKQDAFFRDRLLLPPEQPQTVSARSVQRPSQPPASRNPAPGPIRGFQPPAPVSTGVDYKPQLPRVKKRKRMDYPAGSIMAICEDALAENNIAPYEALRKMDLIRNAGEFLPEMSAEA